MCELLIELSQGKGAAGTVLFLASALIVAAILLGTRSCLAGIIATVVFALMNGAFHLVC